MYNKNRRSKKRFARFDFAERLRRVMKKRKISQSMIERKTGIAQSTISRWLSGKTSPDVNVAAYLCQVMEISAQEIFAEEMDVDIMELMEAIETAILRIVSVLPHDSRKRLAQKLAQSGERAE